MLSSACQLRLNVEIDVDRNGGGVLAVAVAADAELLELAEEADSDPLGDLVTAGESLDGWRVSDGTDDDGTRTVTLSSEFADPAEFEALTAELAETLAADEVEFLEPFSMTVSEDRVSVAGAASAEPRAAVRDYGLTPNEAVRLIKRNDAFNYTLAVRMPGELTSTKPADLSVVAGSQSPAWTVEPGERLSLMVESTRPGPQWVRAALGAVAGAVVAGVVLWLFARRRR